MNLNELAKASHKATTGEGKTILIYGDAKVGKSRLAATIAKVPTIREVHWFDNENGTEGLISMVKQGLLTEAEASKLIIYKIRDSVEQPLAFETMFKVIALKTAFSICEEHGRIIANCVGCTRNKLPSQVFDMSELGSDTAIVVDSGSQLSDSIMHFYNKGKMEKGTSGLDCYREQGLRLVEFLTEVQRAKTNWIVVTHSLTIELEAGTEQIAAMEYKGPKTERVVPLIGTRPFSMKVGKYFGHVVYLRMRLKNHEGGSSTSYQVNTITGSRTNWRLEDQKKPDKTTDLTLVPLFT